MVLNGIQSFTSPLNWNMVAVSLLGHLNFDMHTISLGRLFMSGLCVFTHSVLNVKNTGFKAAN